MQRRLGSSLCGLLLILMSTTAALRAANFPTPQEANYIIHDFHFKDGETLPELRLHYATLGTPARDANGRITNAVLILHGTGGSLKNFTGPTFGGELFGTGQPLDASKFFLVIPDGIGHGQSSKPSDGLRAHFPHYNYDDMVAAQYELLTAGLGVNHLRLVMGTSMGCMHSWVWGETYPDFVDALMPLACLPVQIAGRNRVWRKMAMDSIRDDPAWSNGDYATQPLAGVRFAAYLLLLAGSAPLQWQEHYPTRDQADDFLRDGVRSNLSHYDANDLLYALDASRDYDPSVKLETIQAAVMHVNSADDFVNPPELGIAEREIKRVKRGRFVLLPITEQTRGHGTHTLAAIWKPYLEQLLAQSSCGSGK